MSFALAPAAAPAFAAADSRGPSATGNSGKAASMKIGAWPFLALPLLPWLCFKGFDSHLFHHGVNFLCVPFENCATLQIYFYC